MNIRNTLAASATLHHGATTGVTPCLRVRRLAAGETQPVVEVFDGLSADSRYQRFLTSMPRLTRAIRDGLAAADGHHHVALVAELVCPTPQSIGVAHYIRTSGTTAELGLEVVDAWQGRGVGTRLLKRLIRAATTAGVTELEGTMLTENTRVLALLTSQLRVTTSHEYPGLTRFRARLPTRPHAQSLVA